MRGWIARSWFRHPLSLRPFLRAHYVVKGVGLSVGLASIWDEGWHANHPLIIGLTLLKWRVEFGIKDSN